MLFFGTTAGLWYLYGVLPASSLVRILLVDLLSFPILSFMVFIVKIPTFIYHTVLIRVAVKKLRSHKPMMVIGITGSYGKTSTKEILRTLLSQKYTVLATIASKNSPIAIAELVNSLLQPDTQIFIVEMGAYKKGEIRQMCQMVRPDIGIITAINAQHQDLFGSIENTVEAKYELLSGLTGRRIAVVNADNPYTLDMGRRAQIDGCTVVEYSTKGLKIMQSDTGLRFDSMTVHVFGAHQVSNVLAAMTAAEAIGMTKKEIRHALPYVKPIAHTMDLVKGVNGSTFIDDTFNNNPDAAIAALDYLATKSGRRFLVFQPMIELGAFAKESHERVAKRASEVCDEIILTNSSFSGLFSGRVMSSKEAALHISQTVKSGDTVLFKGKEAGRVLQLLI